MHYVMCLQLQLLVIVGRSYFRNKIILVIDITCLSLIVHDCRRYHFENILR